jgi:large subunit ribosomal protein L24
MKVKLRRDDLVEVIAGRNKGQQGKVLNVDSANGKVLVEGVNYRKCHEKVRQTKDGQAGGIQEREAAIDISNVQIVDPQSKKPVRVAIKEQDGKRVRYTTGKNATGAVLDA